MKQLPLLFISCCALVLSGCETARLPVSHDFDPRHDLPVQSRFEMLPMATGHGSREIRTIVGDGDIPLVAARAVLVEKGFELVEDGTAEFLVGVRAAFRPSRLAEANSLGDVPFQGRSNVERADMTTVVVGAGEPNPNWTPDLDLPGTGPKLKRYAQMDHVRVGTHVSDPSYQLWVEVYDAKTRLLIWQGVTSSHLAASFASDEKRLRAIQRLLADFPN